MTVADSAGGPRGRGGRDPQQLPPGRNRRGHEYVVANQRARILDAVADVNGLAGYVSMSVEDIISTAGVSRRSFYDLFADKQDAFLATLDCAIDDVMGPVRDAVRAASGFAEGVEAAVRAGLETVAEDPRRGELLLIDAPAAGPAAVARRRRTIATLAAMLTAQADRMLPGPPPPPLVAEAVVGGICEIAYARLLHGEIEALRELAPELSRAILRPFLGADDERVTAEA